MYGASFKKHLRPYQLKLIQENHKYIFTKHIYNKQNEIIVI